MTSRVASQNQLSSCPHGEAGPHDYTKPKPRKKDDAGKVLMQTSASVQICFFISRTELRQLLLGKMPLQFRGCFPFRHLTLNMFNVCVISSCPCPLFKSFASVASLFSFSIFIDIRTLLSNKTCGFPHNGSLPPSFLLVLSDSPHIGTSMFLFQIKFHVPTCVSLMLLHLLSYLVSKPNIFLHKNNVRLQFGPSCDATALSTRDISLLSLLVTMPGPFSAIHTI